MYYNSLLIRKVRAVTEPNNITSLNDYKKTKENQALLTDDMVMGFQLNSTITDEEVKSFMEELSNGKVYLTFSFDSSKVLAFKKP